MYKGNDAASELQRIVSLVEPPKPLLFDQHMHFPNPTQAVLKQAKLTFINLMRHPIERELSDFYYSLLFKGKEKKKRHWEATHHGAEPDINIELKNATQQFLVGS